MKFKDFMATGTVVFGIANFVLSAASFLAWSKFAELVAYDSPLRNYDLLLIVGLYLAIVIVTGPIYAVISYALHDAISQGKEKETNESTNRDSC